MPRLMRAQGLLAAGLGVALISCADDVHINSDLNTEGPPRVITVTVLSESADGEAATYCAPESAGEKLNERFCTPGEEVAPVTDAPPLGWYVRVVFNELLIADQVEDLVPGVNDRGETVLVGSLAETQPVTLTCGGEPVAYDGYYNPSGSHLTATPGPSLVIQPTEFVGSSVQDCEVTVKPEIMDKDFETMTQPGPYSFGIGPLEVESTSPESCATSIATDTELRVTFNAYIDAASLAGSIELVALTGPDTEEPVAAPLSVAPDSPRSVLIMPEAPLAEDTDYLIRVQSGVQDTRGGTLALDMPYESVISTAATIMNSDACEE